MYEYEQDLIPLWFLQQVQVWRNVCICTSHSISPNINWLVPLADFVVCNYSAATLTYPRKATKYLCYLETCHRAVGELWLPRSHFSSLVSLKSSTNMSKQIICSFALPWISQNNSPEAKPLFTNNNWRSTWLTSNLRVSKNVSFKTQPLGFEQTGHLWATIIVHPTGKKLAQRPLFRQYWLGLRAVCSATGRIHLPAMCLSGLYSCRDAGNLIF